MRGEVGKKTPKQEMADFWDALSGYTKILKGIMKTNRKTSNI